MGAHKEDTCEELFLSVWSELWKLLSHVLHFCQNSLHPKHCGPTLHAQCVSWN